jgi:hypothetical protein
MGATILKNVARQNADAAGRLLLRHSQAYARLSAAACDHWRRNMDEFGGGFIRNVMIGFALALAFSIIYVWYTR